MDEVNPTNHIEVEVVSSSDNQFLAAALFTGMTKREIDQIGGYLSRQLKSTNKSDMSKDKLSEILLEWAEGYIADAKLKFNEPEEEPGEDVPTE